MNKEIRGRVASILIVLSFLVLSTVFFYMPRHNVLMSSMAFLQMKRSFYVEDLSNGISIKDAYPVKDSEGLKNNPYTFKIVNNSNKEIKYQIIFSNDIESNNILENNYLRYSLSNIDDENIKIDTLSNDGIIFESTLKAKEEKVFNYRMWLNYDSDENSMGKIFVGTIKIEKVK